MAYQFLQLDPVTGRRKLVAGSSGTWEQETPAGTVNGSNTVFTLVFTPLAAGSTFVYLNSLIIPVTDYVLDLGLKTVTFSTAPATAQKVYVVYLK